MNRKNLIDAYSRLGPPHTPIMKNIGSRTISKKMKKRIRSWATNVPFMPDLEQEDQREERLRVVRLGEVVPRVDDAQTVMSIDRSSSGSEMPSMPDVVAAVDHVDPRLVGRELQPAVVVVEVGEDPDADRRASASVVSSATTLISALLGLRDQQHDRHADERDEDRQRQGPVVEPVHCRRFPSDQDVGE